MPLDYKKPAKTGTHGRTPSLQAANDVVAFTGHFSIASSLPRISSLEQALWRGQKNKEYGDGPAWAAITAWRPRLHLLNTRILLGISKIIFLVGNFYTGEHYCLATCPKLLILNKILFWQDYY